MGWTGIFELVLVGFALLAVFVYILGRERAMRRRLQYLAEVTAVSDRAADLEQTLDAICGVLVPDFADFCMVDVIESGQVRRAAVRVADGAAEGIEEWLAMRRPSVPEWMLDGDDDAALEPRFYEHFSERDLRELTSDPADLEMMRRLAPRSAITLALRARGRVTGALTLGVSWSGRRYRAEDARFAWILSGRVALALDNSDLFADLERAERARAEIGETLQHGLLPPPLPEIPGWSVAAMYRPAGAENEVGGDFYDVFRVPGGWMLVIGDVTGRGAHAASITAVARYTLRTAAMLADDPLVALGTLNRALLARGDTALCSLTALTLSEDAFEPVRVAVAGHPPPLLVDGDSVTEVAGADPILGAFEGARWRISRAEVEPGQQLAVVTDGIAEAVGAGERFGERRLHAELAGVDNPGFALRRLETALGEFAGGELLDDIAILAIARDPGDRAGGGEGAPVVEELYAAFNARDAATLARLCDERMEFFPFGTAEAIGRAAPYTGPAGVREYLTDVATVWDVLEVTPGWIEERDGHVLVRGRVYARSRRLGIRDVPFAWLWELRDGRFVRGELFPDPEQARSRFAAVAA